MKALSMLVMLLQSEKKETTVPSENTKYANKIAPVISRYIKDHIENTKITSKMAAIQCKETTVPIENTINFFSNKR